MSFYLLEIGCEELPASFVPLAANYIKNEAVRQLEAIQMPYGKILADGTPRRIYLYIDGLPQRQEDRTETVQGPPAKVAFNPDGTVSPVGLKFAESKGLDKASLTKATTDKGDYLSGTKKIIGQDTSALLPHIISHIVTSIPFPKSMRWGRREIRFGRPLKYLMSIYDGKLLQLDVPEIETVNTTTGHHFLAPQSFGVTDLTSYTEGLKKAFVIVNEADRRELIEKQIAGLASQGGYRVDIDEDLLNTVVNLVEYPYAIEGRFEEQFLQLPAPVLITSMKHHQKYFPVYKEDNIQAAFIGISNIQPEDPSLIREGYERVLKARLNDALFFYNNDKGVPLEKRLEMLKKVVYQEKLGTSYEKMERFRQLAASLAGDFAPGQVDEVEQAATLAKADLMTEMVYEFPELQGFMGKVYAKIQGKPDRVANAIEEHYMPRFAGDDLPPSDIGRIVAIADKLDTVAGAFAIDMIPTGNVDPYGLRRNAIGIINIMENAGWRVPFKALISQALELVSPRATVDMDTTSQKLLAFFIQRHKQLLLSRGETEADAYDAAVVNFQDFISQREKAAALTAAKKSESFQSIAQSYKRINNILKKAEHAGLEIKSELFEHPEEKDLFQVYQSAKDTIKKAVKEENWQAATEALILFAEPLNNFFDKVMVMAQEDKIRNNRLALLNALKELFISVGDLGEIIG